MTIFNSKRKAILIFLTFGLVFASFPNSAEYKYVDKPFYEALDYFFGTAGYYLGYAKKIGKILFMLSLLWNCLKVIFGFTNLQKMTHEVIGRYLLFLGIMFFYTPVTSALRQISTRIGQNVGFGREKINSTLTEYMRLLDKQVKKVDDEYDADLSALQIDIEAMKADATPYTNSPYYNLSLQAKQQRKTELEKQRKIQEENPSGKRRRLKSIKEFMGATGQDLEGNFAFDLDLKYGGSDIGFLSPNAVLRLAILMMNIIMTTPDVRIDSETGEMVEIKRSLNPFAKDSFISIGWIGEKILCAFTSIFLMICTIFALIQYCMTALEFAITQGFCIILIPMMLFDWTKSFSDNILKVFFALCVKLILVTECMIFMMVSYMSLMSDVVGATNFNWTNVCYIVFTTILCFMMTQYAPQIAQTVITGNPQLSMGEFMKSALTAGAVSQVTARAGVESGKAAMQGVANVTSFGAGAKASMAGGGGIKGLANFAGQSAKSGIKNFVNRVGDAGHAILTPGGIKNAVMGTGMTAQQERAENARNAQFARGVFDKDESGNRLGLRRAINEMKIASSASGLKAGGDVQQGVSDKNDVPDMKNDSKEKSSSNK